MKPKKARFIIYAYFCMCFIAILGWIQSVYTHAAIDAAVYSPRIYTIASGAGILRFETAEMPNVLVDLHGNTVTPTGFEFHCQWPYLIQWNNWRWISSYDREYVILGFGVGKERDVWRRKYIQFPYWLLVVLSLIWPARHWWKNRFMNKQGFAVLLKVK